jgi:hypothetical protein
VAQGEQRPDIGRVQEDITDCIFAKEIEFGS